ncbi:MAG: cupin domain-containing protein [Proteobacteria bacterium]|jgi:mannose-6-phosphate isomerase-like protein (cupin superfamily)|nr:cupin domain-containing protein [Pseudomonadota bacterium]
MPDIGKNEQGRGPTKASGTFGAIEIIVPECNPTTVVDGRGGIFTWVPKEPIVEFNLLYFRPGKVRGNHFHPEFVEYFLIVDGKGVMCTRDENSEDLVMHASAGTCFRTPINTTHAFHAITDTICMSFLTKPWDDCKPPRIQENIIPFDEEYQKYALEQGLDNSSK